MNDFNFKKKFGQNFITDKNLLAAICNDAQLTSEDDVLEIGAGAGSLTSIIDSRCHKLVSYEIDLDLQTHLTNLNLSSTKFVFCDIMTKSLEEVERDFPSSYKLIANLPYYITSPLIFKFIKSTKISSITIMVQKEVAQRIVSQPGDKDYGVLPVMVAFYGQAKLKRVVGQNMFSPPPNVDSAVVTIVKDKKYQDIDEQKFYSFVSSMFSMRRKTLNNNLRKSGISQEKLIKLGEDNLKKRPEEFSLDEIISFYRLINEC